ncbi:MAG: N-acetylglucosamine-6-phosphate deacetylase, partial [Bacteroidales bacterium]|nr:N-acetylglucosamine-6-phosphate deacetylase [Bacteroidales bacterium]
IFIENEKITKVFAGCGNLPAADNVIDGTGLTALPGFIDVHCHGRNNFDFCDANVEGVNFIGRGKLEEGVTTLLPTTLTLSEESLAETLSSIASYDGSGCRMPAVHLEGPYINGKMIGAQNPEFVRKPDAEEVARLNRVYPVKKVSFAPEVEGGAAFTSRMVEMGIVPSAVHTNAKYDDFCRCHEAGLRNLSHFCNQMSPLHHRDIGMVGAGLYNDDVYCELICDKIHICPDMIKLAFKIKGPGKIILITDAMRASGMPFGEYSLGGLPVTLDETGARLHNGALAGSTLQLNIALKNVVELTGLPLSEAVRAASTNAAEALSLEGFGRIEEGYIADIVLLDEEFNVRRTIVGGELRYQN